MRHASSSSYKIQKGPFFQGNNILKGGSVQQYIPKRQDIVAFLIIFTYEKI
jgi:hypothetical protein